MTKNRHRIIILTVRGLFSRQLLALMRLFARKRWKMHKCPKCGHGLTTVEGTKNLHQCPSCNARFYIANCWQCGASIFEHDEPSNHCKECHWYKCNNCGACSRECMDIERQRDIAQMFEDTMLACGDFTFVAYIPDSPDL